MLDTDDNDLRARMQRAVGGLHAPDLVTRVMADGRRARHQQRVRYATGGVAAVAAAGAIAYPLIQNGEDRTPTVRDNRSAGPASQGTPSTDSTPPPGDPCGERPAGWWDMPSDQVRATLNGLLPAGVSIGKTEDDAVGTWSGNLIQADGPDFAMVSLLPPESQSPPERQGDVICIGPSGPLQEIEACDPEVTCEEIRDDEGNLVGIVTEKLETTIVDGGDEATDKSYLIATLLGPDGGTVEVYVGEGTRDDVPTTVHDPADQPALTFDQVKQIVTAPVWTGYAG